MITAIAITLDLVFGVKSGKVGQTYDTGFPKSMVNVIYQGAHPLSLYPHGRVYSTGIRILKRRCLLSGFSVRCSS